VTIVRFPGRGAHWPPLQPGVAWPPATGVTLLDALNEKLVAFGRVTWDDGGTHDIDDIGFLTTTVTPGSGSTFEVSTRAVDLTAGPAPRDDGVVIQSYSSGTMPTANAWNKVALASPHTAVAHGALLAVCFELTGFGSETAINISRFTNMDGRQSLNADGMSSFLASTWANVFGVANVALFSDDGAIGTLGPYWLTSSATLQEAWNSGTNPDERGNEFTVDAPIQIDHLWALLGPSGGASADFDLVLYEGTTAVRTVSFDANASPTATRCYVSGPIAPLTLAVGTTYRLVVKPTTANNVDLVVFTYAEAAMRKAFCGTNAAYVTRNDGGAFAAATTTKAAAVGVIISGVDDASGGGGGGGAPFSRVRLGR
jgi:hypothetical protein